MINFQEVRNRKHDELIDKIALAILPIIYSSAVEQSWHRNGPGDWTEEIGTEIWKKARIIASMKNPEQPPTNHSDDLTKLKNQIYTAKQRDK